jgi:hypothetical protein
LFKIEHPLLNWSVVRCWFLPVLSEKFKYVRADSFFQGFQDWKARIRNQCKIYPVKKRKGKQVNHCTSCDMNELVGLKTPRAIFPSVRILSYLLFAYARVCSIPSNRTVSASQLGVDTADPPFKTSVKWYPETHFSSSCRSAIRVFFGGLGYE